MWDGDKKKMLLVEYQTTFVLTQSLTIRRDKQNLTIPGLRNKFNIRHERVKEES
jgi:hypothetical protein